MIAIYVINDVCKKRPIDRGERARKLRKAWISKKEHIICQVLGENKKSKIWNPPWWQSITEKGVSVAAGGYWKLFAICEKRRATVKFTLQGTLIKKTLRSHVSTSDACKQVASSARKIYSDRICSINLEPLDTEVNFFYHSTSSVSSASPFWCAAVSSRTPSLTSQAGKCMKKRSVPRSRYMRTTVVIILYPLSAKVFPPRRRKNIFQLSEHNKWKFSIRDDVDDALLLFRFMLEIS